MGHLRDRTVRPRGFPAASPARVAAAGRQLRSRSSCITCWSTSPRRSRCSASSPPRFAKAVSCSSAFRGSTRSRSTATSATASTAAIIRWPSPRHASGGLLARAGLTTAACLDDPELDRALSDGQPLRLRVVATRTSSPPPLPVAPLRPALAALARYARSRPDWRDRWQYRLPVRLRGALLDRRRA